jgi:SecD/SecF fusion protein
MVEAISTPEFLMVAAVPFFQSGMFLFLLLIAAVVGGIFLARFVTSSLKVSEYSGRAAVVLVSVLVAALMIYSKWPPKFGVDLSGGINMIGSLNLGDVENQMTQEKPTAKDIIPVLMQRVNPSGTEEIMIRPLGTDKIEVTMPTVDLQQAMDIWDNLVKVGLLEFRIIANPSDHADVFDAAEQLRAAGDRSDLITITESDGTVRAIGRWVDIARVFNEKLGRIEKDAPFKYIPSPGASVRNGQTGQPIDMRSVPLTGDLDRQKVQLARWAADQKIRDIQVLVSMPEERFDVQGKHLSGVSLQPDEKGRNSVAFKLTSEGSMKMGRLTSRNIEKPMGIVLDNQIHSAPVIQSRITKQGTITGDFSRVEINDLIGNLNSGKLDVALNKQPISSDFVESTLGNELKQKGFWAIGISMGLVLVFMMFYYRFAGIVAALALLLNFVLILALVMAVGVKFTLTGLAGLVLTVGMSVDANVLIFERIREELSRGAALRMAIRNGFDKARTTIVDANVTTLITALVLYAIGTEQIKGFAVTLVLGILMSMFTAIYVSRLVFDIWERKRWLKELTMAQILEKGNYQFLNKTAITGVISVALIIAGLVGTFSLGARILDQDLRGGSTARAIFKDGQALEDIQSTMDALDIVYEPTQEKVEFNVTTYGEDDTANAKKFKFDSNLPAWEGEGSGVAKFKELDEILAETFAGKLQLHSVEIEGQTANAESGAGDAPEQSSNRSIEQGTAASFWNGVPTIGGSVSLTSGLLTYQEGAAAESTTQEAGVAVQEADQEADQETVPAGETAESAEGAESDPQTPVAADAAQDAGAAAAADKQVVNVTRNVTVDPETMGKTLASFIVEAAKRVDVKLDKDQVKLNTPDVVDDESPLTTISKNWSITMEVRNEEEADKILGEWQQRFNSTPYFPTSSSVGGQIAGQTSQQAILAIVASLIGIIAYVWIRFQNLAFGLAAVVALIHDVLIVLGAIAISHWLGGFLWFLKIEEFKISLEIIAALLTVIGYSLNDTIVVFDRIREVRGKRTEITADMINTSISQTLSRTILTSVTTFIVVFILYWFGGDAIHGFAFALVIGVIVGTYSSIFVASPALLWLMNTVGLNPGEIDPEVAKAS